MKIEYTVKRGKFIGRIFTPHRHEDGLFVVSKTRFRRDYIRVLTLADVLTYLDKGFRVRVSDPSGDSPTSLVSKRSLAIR